MTGKRNGHPKAYSLATSGAPWALWGPGQEQDTRTETLSVSKIVSLYPKLADPGAPGPFWLWKVPSDHPSHMEEGDDEDE
jgi:hypothetical protein